MPLPTAHFVAHVIGQVVEGDPFTAALAAASYEQADSLGRSKPPQLIASL